MIIADRLRALREQKHLSQGDIEKRTGLLRCYLSRVE
ncbi:MAG: transcriptional regulator, partial [Candidatus Acidiferrales bacterium]